MGGSEITLTSPGNSDRYYNYYWWVPYDNQLGYAPSGHTKTLVEANSQYFEPHVRCVYDEWYWSDQKYGNNGQPTTGNAATQWLGYIF